jgi:hypothetical protein
VPRVFLPLDPPAFERSFLIWHPSATEPLEKLDSDTLAALKDPPPREAEPPLTPPPFQ